MERKLRFKRRGIFTAAITFEQATYLDAVVTGTFAIEKIVAPTGLSFTKFTRSFADDRTIMAADIWAKITGDKTGYALKSIGKISDPSVAALSGLKAIRIKTAGDFTAEITLERANYEDAKVTGVFSIGKLAALAGLSFSKLIKPFGEPITTADIQGQVQNIQGYTLKALSGISDASVAALSGLKEIIGKKTGGFSADLVLEKANHEEVRLPNSAFEFIAPVLDFEPLEKYNNDKNNALISTEEIMAQVRGKGKTGYTLKEIRNISDGVLAELSGLKTIKAKTEATFTAELVLERAGFYDAAITGCKFSYVNVFNVGRTISLLPVYGHSVDSQIVGFKKGYHNKFKILNIPSTIEGKTITHIGQRAFSRDTALESLTLPNSMLVLEDEAFSECAALTSVTLPESKLSVIGMRAFYKCTALTAITIPTTVREILREAFKDSTNLVITLQTNNYKIINYGAAQFVGAKQIRVPNAYLADYKTKAKWTAYDYLGMLVGY